MINVSMSTKRQIDCYTEEIIAFQLDNYQNHIRCDNQSCNSLMKRNVTSISVTVDQSGYSNSFLVST